MKPAAPIFDGTADTYGACDGKHGRLLDHDDDDGIVGGQGRHASVLRDGYVQICVVLVGILGILSFALWLALRR